MSQTSQNPAGGPGSNQQQTSNYGGNANTSRPWRQGIDTNRLRERLRGQWLTALQQVAPALGLAISKIPKHVTCLKHGGVDGFRMFPDANQTGGGNCNTCGFFPDGFALVQWANDWNFPTTKKALAVAVGMDRSMEGSSPAPCTRPTAQTTPPHNQKAWDRIQAVAQGVVPLDDLTAGPFRLYMGHRGLAAIMTDLPGPTVLGFHPGLSYWHDSQSAGAFPAMVARVQNLDKATVCLHRTYLSSDGHKANVPEAKKLMVPVHRGATQGAAIRLYSAVDTLSIAEGLETCLAVRLGTGDPVWSTISAGGMEALQLPATIRNVNIWADLDRSGIGQRAAESLAHRLVREGRTVCILTPPGAIPDGAKSIDWLDILNSERGLP